VYRTLDAVIEERLARLRVQRGRTQDAAHAAWRVLGRREGRATAGAVAAAGALLTFGAAFLTGGEAGQVFPIVVLVLTWPVTAVAGVVAYVVSMRRAARRWGLEPVLTGDPAQDLAALGTYDPLGDLRAQATRREATSIGLPLVGLSLLAPISIHGLVALVLMTATGKAFDFSPFTFWIALSAFAAGLAHVALVVQAVFWTAFVSKTDVVVARARLAGVVGRTMLVTVFVSFFPAIFFIGDIGPVVLMPPGITLVTGLLFVPWAFRASVVTADQERAMLEHSIIPVTR
jgi:hypothetical protein